MEDGERGECVRVLACACVYMHAYLGRLNCAGMGGEGVGEAERRAFEPGTYQLRAHTWFTRVLEPQSSTSPRLGMPQNPPIW